MNRKAHMIAVSLFALCAVAAPVASIVANAPDARPVPVLAEEAPGAPADLPSIPPPPPAAAPEAAEVTVPVTIVGGARKAPRKAEETRCYEHVLEQGGSPTAPTVRVCG